MWVKNTLHGRLFLSQPIYHEGGIVIPNIDFTTFMLNVSNSDIEKSDIITMGDTIYYDVTLVRKPMRCPTAKVK